MSRWAGLAAAPAGLCHVRGFTCHYRVALSARMLIFQRLRALAAEPNWLENRLYFANVTMPPSPH
jgi:hypothetical protein